MGLFSRGTTTTLRVEGMTCGHCQGRVEKALAAVPGVTKAQVDLAGGKATVVHGKEATPDALVKAVEGAGYTASPLS
ncbi:MAG TPA: heavy metal-associated domain-containing protein [Candidatus Thermoplasmatota archaeon]|nr:heavy metal-associated domain-containing protein [Candidatus Thermoplasmatota archaeon]